MSGAICSTVIRVSPLGSFLVGATTMSHFGKVLTVAISTATLSLLQAVGTTTPALNDLVTTTASVRVLAAAQASPITYVPPDRGSPRQTQGTGSRGCEDLDTIVDVSLIAPSDHTGLTVSERPVFYWHLRDAVSVPLEFTLVEDGNPEPIYVKRFETSSAGMTSVSLPEARVLEVGKTYRWTVSVVCNPQRRSSDVFVQSWIERVEPSADLQTALAEATTAREIAQVYAQAGLWYDAIEALDSNEDRMALVNAERLVVVGE